MSSHNRAHILSETENRQKKPSGARSRENLLFRAHTLTGKALPDNLADLCQDRGIKVKSDHRSEVFHLEFEGNSFAIKRFPPLWSPLGRMKRRLLKGLYAASVWQRILLVFEQGLPIAEPIGFTRSRNFLGESYLVCRWIDADPSIARLTDPDSSLEHRKALTSDLTGIIATMHNHNFTHGDLKPRNVLITEHGPMLIDLDAVRHHRFTPAYRRRARRDWSNLIIGLEAAGVEASVLDPLYQTAAELGFAITRRS